jgi:hypothetical protein
MAENYANAAMLASSAISEVAPLTRAFCREALRDENPPRPNPRMFGSEIQALTVSIARLSRDDQARFLAPMFPARQTSLWMAREPLLSEFDPIAIALGLLAKTTVNKFLPGEGDVEKIDGLVVVSSSAKAAGFSEQDVSRVLAKAIARGRPISVLMISGTGTPQGEVRKSGTPWRKSITLSDLAAFIELRELSPSSAAA